jgi:hypothetical protein
MKRPRIKDLYCDCIGVEPITCDWREILGDDMEGWRSYEAVDCDECGETLVLSVSNGGDLHRNIDSDSSCSGNIPECEGPMMNYWYPIDIKDCEEAARKLVCLPLCVVEFPDGTTGLALTGGGMDLSWEICNAFMLLGQLPPVHFELPAMCGRGVNERDRWVIAGVRKACQVMAKRMAWRLKKLKDTVAWGRDYAAKRSA